MAPASLADQLAIAGLSLGAFSTTVDIFAAVSGALKAWRDVETVDGDVAYFRAMLLLQNDVLSSWQQDWYARGSQSRSLSNARLNLLKAHDATVKTTLSAVKAELDRVSPIKMLSKTTTLDMTAIDTMVWVANQHQVAEDALRRVRDLLDGLYKILPPQAPDPYAQLMVGLLPDEIVDVERILREVDNDEESDSLLSRAYRLQRLRQTLDRDLEERTRLLQYRLPQISCKIPNMVGWVNEDNVEGTRGRKIDGSIELIVEWKEYRVFEGQEVIQLLGRCMNLARILQEPQKPRQLLSLPCQGFFDDIDRKRFGFVFRSPATRGQQLVSLHQLLVAQATKPVPNELPSLHDRFRMAYTLALALSIVFSIGWLHKGIRSHNILFLKTGHDVQWDQPFLVGYSYSREDKPDSLSEKLTDYKPFNVYRHPNAQHGSSAPYRQTFDIYSFGIVLSEIASWKPTPLFRPERLKDAAALQAYLTSSNSRKQLSYRMGQEFCEAMMKCVDGRLEQSAEGEDKAFFVQVVECLRRQIPF